MFICTGAAVTAQPSDKFTGSLLWRISGNGLEHPSYILGTHHFYALGFFDQIPGARAALEGATQVVGELLMSDMAGLASRIQLAAMMPEGESYERLLSPSDYEILDSGLRKLTGVGLFDQFKVFKPGMIALLISQITYAQAHPEFNAATHVAIDVYVQNFAAENNRAVFGLETVDDQIYTLFESEPMKYQAEQLVCGIQHIDFGIESIRKLGELYAAGDLAGMYAKSFNNPDDPCPSSETLQNAMARERNDNWLKKLPAIMSEAPSFIAVGALHLAGEEGLLFRLDGMGYTVEAVK